MIIDTSEEKRRCSWKSSRLISVILLIMCIIFVSLGGLFYILGRLGRHAFPLACIVHPAAIGVIFLTFIEGIRGLTRGLRGDMKFLLLAQIFLPVVFILLAVIMPPLLVKSPLWPDATPFTYGFRDRVESKADIPAIRAWLKTLNPEEYAEPGDRVPQDKWPEFLKVLSPGIVYVLVDKNGVLQVRLTWGGAIFHWGLTIGMEDFKIPVSELDDHYEAWLLVQPGVYV